jgi:phosphoribosyl-ATP pyrophosphohydrolase
MAANKGFDAQQLDALFATIAARKGSDPNSSYTASLLAKGPQKCAEKMGEEAVETIIAAVSGSREEAISESADLLYHWLVLAASLDISPAEVYGELARREGVSGLDEKASRPSNSSDA